MEPWETRVLILTDKVELGVFFLYAQPLRVTLVPKMVGNCRYMYGQPSSSKDTTIMLYNKQLHEQNTYVYPTFKLSDALKNACTDS